MKKWSWSCKTWEMGGWSSQANYLWHVRNNLFSTQYFSGCGELMVAMMGGRGVGSSKAFASRGISWTSQVRAGRFVDTETKIMWRKVQWLEGQHHSWRSYSHKIHIYCVRSAERRKRTWRKLLSLCIFIYNKKKKIFSCNHRRQVTCILWVIELNTQCYRFKQQQRQQQQQKTTTTTPTATNSSNTL